MAVNIFSITMFVSFYKGQKEGCWKTGVGFFFCFLFSFQRRALWKKGWEEGREEKRKKKVLAIVARVSLGGTELPADDTHAVPGLYTAKLMWRDSHF